MNFLLINLKKPILNLNFKYQVLLYLLFLILVVGASIVYALVFIEKFPYNFDQQLNLIVKSIQFGNGPLIYNMIYLNEYKVQYYGIDFYLQKLPLLPWFYYLILKFSNNFFIFIIIKNIVSFSVLYFACFFSLCSLNKRILDFLILILFIFLIPYNLFVTLNYQYSDCLLVVLLPSLFLILNSKLKNRFLLASIILFALYLTKTSMLFIVTVLPIFVIFYEKKSFIKYNILIGPILAIILWGSFSYDKINKFVFGANNLTVNSMGMHLATHPEFFDYYPDRSVDLLHAKIDIPPYIKNEREFYNYFDTINKEYFSSYDNKISYLKESFIKINFILFSIKRDGSINKESSIRYSHIVNKIIFNLAIIMSIFFFLKYFKNFFKNKIEFYYLLIIALNMLPYVAGWATSKHLIPAFIISFYYLYLRTSLYSSYLNGSDN